MLKQGEILELGLDSLACGGDAVGRHLGQTVFVPYGLPGDKARVKVFDAHQKYCRASIISIVSPGEQRIKPACPHFGDCGSCQWQMLDHPHQLEHKKTVLEQTLARIGGIKNAGIKVLAEGSPWHYRNKAQYPVAQSKEKLIIGYYRQGSHQVVPIEECPIIHPRLNQVFMQAREILLMAKVPGYDELTNSGILRHLILRYGQHQDKMSLTLVCTKDKIYPEVIKLLSAIPRVGSVWLNLNAEPGNTILGKEWRLLSGESRMEEELDGIKYRLSAGSFWQVNQPLAGALYRLIKEELQLTRQQQAVDLYCGAGAISLQLALMTGKVVGIESSAQAVDDARDSARLNGIANAEFMAGPAEALLEKVQQADAVVCDPPRSGLKPEVIRGLDRLKPQKIAYLSCDPATLARDLKEIMKTDYQIAGLYLADMFPQTYHIETLAVLQRR
ncbi:23S rRNA (uracil(1939)-C(5))-methyltransferase RlmD [candidate division TA06 bacterium]|uniref:23S rRNA (Uracil(1939)-C(5))-methyltransferase RlmD n=1 Tax=candidate division TA06 bacterium TaxID=2250710 RepID=A0A933I9D5_UNCT6|nr:23S rRNA (uracil(1939)-C(5))-methyltransferase RlmD [candidate division TA06 bacterium]